MDVTQFWSILDTARNRAGGWEDMLSPLVTLLSELETNDLMIWARIFDEYHHLSYKEKLWAAAYIINGGCSDDGFDYFRGWLTAQGKDVYLSALNDPDSLAVVDACEGDVEFEDILGAAFDAYREKMKIQDALTYDHYLAELDKYPLPDQIRQEMISEINYADGMDLDWDEDDEDSLSKLFPKLADAFDF